MSEIDSGGFRAWFHARTDGPRKPTQGVVTVDENQNQLACTADAGTVEIPLLGITDVQVGQLPDTLGPIPPGRIPISVSYDGEDERADAVVAASQPSARELAACLFEARLSGEQVHVKHPSSIGSHKTDISFERATLTLDEGILYFERDERIDLGTLTQYEQVEPSVDDTFQRPLRLQYVNEDTRCSTLLHTDDASVRRVLKEFLRLQS